MPIVLGNVSVTTDTASRVAPFTRTYSHNSNGDALLVLATVFDSANVASTVDIALTFNGVSLVSLALPGQTQEVLDDDTPRIEAFLLLTGAAQGVNNLVFQVLNSITRIEAHSIVAISLPAIGGIGGIGSNFSDTNVASLAALVDIQAIGSLLIGQVAVRGGGLTSITPNAGLDATVTPHHETGASTTADYSGLIFDRDTAALGSTSYGASWVGGGRQAAVLGIEVLGRVVTLAGTSSTSTEASGSSSVERPLAGASSSVTEGSGALAVERPLEADSLTVTAANGALTTNTPVEVFPDFELVGSGSASAAFTMEGDQ